MGQKTRWAANTVNAAANCNTQMPWERGLRRQAMIARRLEETESKTKVTLPPMPAGVFLAANG